MAYGHIYNQTTHLCQCGSYDDCFSGSLTATVCLDGTCGCSEAIDKCEDSGHGIGVCVGGSCENLMGKQNFTVYLTEIIKLKLELLWKVLSQRYNLDVV